MAAKRKSNGGLKGFFSRASKSFKTGGLYARDQSLWLTEKLMKLGLIIATTSIVVLMPLVFEIAREGQVSFLENGWFFSILFHYVSDYGGMSRVSLGRFSPWMQQRCFFRS